MIIPIGTDVRPRRPPVGNYILIALNVLVFLFTDLFGGHAGQQLKNLWTLYAAVPEFGQYITYQFLHGDVLHLAGNMLFLWIFGNAVCDRMGSLPYVLFYLAGGIAAGITFSALNHTAILGASGSIAAVTTAFLVLYPRVHITLMIWLIIITAIQVPAMIVIVFKIILWDNIIAPGFDQSAVANVAYSAHLGGYTFGFLVAIALLGFRALPRNQFDLLSLWSLYQRRTGIGQFGGSGALPARARPVTVHELDSRPLEPVELSPVDQLREKIIDRLRDHDPAGAAELYFNLRTLDPDQVLPRQAQLDLANYFAQAQRHADAAHTYEAFLSAYPTAPDTPQVRLLLGLIYARYLRDPARAADFLRAALAGLNQREQRELAIAELRQLGPFGEDTSENA